MSMTERHTLWLHHQIPLRCSTCFDRLVCLIWKSYFQYSVMSFIMQPTELKRQILQFVFIVKLWVVVSIFWLQKATHTTRCPETLYSNYTERFFKHALNNLYIFQYECLISINSKFFQMIYLSKLRLASQWLLYVIHQSIFNTSFLLSSVPRRHLPAVKGQRHDYTPKHVTSCYKAFFYARNFLWANSITHKQFVI